MKLDTAPAKAGPRAYFGLAILVILTILSYVDRTIILLLVEPIKADLGIDDVQFSLLTGLSFAMLYAVLGVPFGWLADRYSRRWIIYLGVTAWSIATGLCGLATSFWHLFLARMGVGVGEATLSPVGYAIAGDLFSRRRLALATSTLAAGTALGAAIAYGIGGVLMDWAEARGGLFGLRPWQTAIVMLALPGLLIAPFVFVIPKYADKAACDDRTEQAGTPEGYLRWLKANLSHLIPMMAGAACIYALMFGVTAWMPALLFRRFAMSPTEVGALLGLSFGVSGVTGFILSGWIVDWLATTRMRHAQLKYMTFVIAALGLVGLATFTLAGTTTQIATALGLLALLAPVNGPAMAYLQIHTPAQFRGRTIAIFLLVYNLFGMTLGPAAVALISQEVYGDNIGAGMATMSAIAGVAGSVLLIFAQRHEPAMDNGNL
ncbi:MFS transporter [Novosphingobium pentaromativorans]|nr:MFS transporter [Novosphingobium pentaromativorans]